MPPRNVNVILIAGLVSWLCYSTASGAKKAILVGEAIQLIDQFYVDPVNDAALVEAAMDGMTATLDEHSEYIPPGMYGAFQDMIEQEFAGIGILVEQPEQGKPVRVITPLVGSPALEAGVLPKDEILKVDGLDVSTMEIGDVSNRLRGVLDTSVTVTVRRKVSPTDEKLIDIQLFRKSIEMESVVGDYRDGQSQWVYRLKSHPEIAYIRLTSFGEKTVNELKRVLESLNSDFDALIFDVRANSGGLLNAAVDVCDDFLESGRIVTIKKRGGEIDSEFDASPGLLVRSEIPMVVLIDGNSASASEIVAACLQDHKRAFIVGSRSYGKGTVQNVLTMDFGRSALKLTTARYYRPNGRNIHRLKDAKEEDEWGVMPDEGLNVLVNDEGFAAILQQWQKASFPVISMSEGDASNSDGESKEKQDDENQNPAPSEPVDPQLERAIERLRESIQAPSSNAEPSKPSRAAA